MSRPHPVRLSVASLALVFAGACADQSPVAPTHTASSAARRDVSTSAVTWANEITGTTADGAQYSIYVRPAGMATSRSPMASFRLRRRSLPGPQDWMTPEHCVMRSARRYSRSPTRFSENGYAIKDGIQRTNELRASSRRRVGRPNRAFLIGHSLGAQVVQALAESYPGQYNGALAMCGVLGGTKFQVDYVGNTRALFDFFYPGVLPGNVMSLPENTNPVTQIQLPALNAVLANPAFVPLIAFANQTRLAGNTNLEIITSLLNALVYHALGVNDLLARTHGHILFDNSTTFYSSALIPDGFYVPVQTSTLRASPRRPTRWRGWRTTMSRPVICGFP